MLRTKRYGVLTGFLILFVIASTCAGAPLQRSQRRPMRRAAPPTQWEPVVREMFEANAFARLDGKPLAVEERPNVIHDDPRPPQPTEGEDFDRSEIMQQLQRESMIVDEFLASPEALIRPTAQAKQAVENILELGRRLANDDPDYSADVHYVRRAEGMAGAAKRLKGLLGTAKHGEVLDAVRSIQSSCTACHAKFKP